MKIEFHRDMQNPQTIEVTRVLILDNFNNPLAIAVEVEHGIIILETANEPVKLNAVLRGLGINATVVVHDAQQRKLPEIQIPGM